MKKRIVLPSDVTDITIKDYLFITNLDKDLPEVDQIREVFKHFSKLSDLEIENVNGLFVIEETEKILQLYLKLQAIEKNVVTIRGVEFGLELNFNKISTGQFIDITKYKEEEEGDFIKLVSCLFRPIKNNSIFNNYELEKYNGTGHSDYIENMPYVYALHGINKLNEFLNNLAELYPEIYKGSGTSESLSTDYFEKWGWYATLVDVSKGDILKMAKVFKKNVHEFHLFVAHKIDKQKLKERLMKRKI
jgi:hypothetical protein